MHVKCVVWDLDGTVWTGTLLEGDDPAPRQEALDAIRTLDRRGILSSIASHNDEALATAALDRLGIRELFVEPRIGWAPKPDAVRDIADALGLSLDSFAFVDDDPFQRDHVRHALPDVRCYGPDAIGGLLALPEFDPPPSPGAADRRRRYQVEARRRADGRAFDGPPAAFLASLGMVLTVAPAREADLLRAAELTVRTHQLNTTGVAYSRDELLALSRSERHLVLVAELTDRYGDYGQIGLALLEREEGMWTLRLFLVSCRVLARGIAGVFLGHLARMAGDAGVRLRAELVRGERNRLMLVALRFAGFAEVARSGPVLVLECGRAPAPPAHVIVRDA
jgi:FkbH-like protein